MSDFPTSTPVLEKPLSFAIMGAPVSSGNRGVLALGASLVNLCSQTSINSEVTLLLMHRDAHPISFRVGGFPRPIPVVNCRLSPRSKLRDHFIVILLFSIAYRIIPIMAWKKLIKSWVPWIKAVEETDVVGNVHGGDSFSDIYGLQRFLLNFLLDWSVLLVNGTMVQFPQTYGPYKHWLARRLTRYQLKRSSHIIARDLKSQKIAQSIVGADKQVLLSPDVAFSLESLMPETVELDPALSGPIPSGIIGLNVNGLMYNGGYTRSNMFGLKMDYAKFLSELVTDLLREHPGELWLVPHTFAPLGDVESDQEASRKLRDSLSPMLRSRVRIVTREYDQHEIKGVISLCDFFIGSRMHACIAALSQGVPCVGVAYSMKFEGVFESVGMRDWVIDGRSQTNETAITRTTELYRKRETVRKPLAEASAEARRRLKIIFANLFSTNSTTPN